MTLRELANGLSINALHKFRLYDVSYRHVDLFISWLNEDAELMLFDAVADSAINVWRVTHDGYICVHLNTTFSENYLRNGNSDEE